MYKKILMAGALVLASLTIIACGSATVPKQAIAKKVVATDDSGISKHMEEITLEAKGKKYDAELESNNLTQQIISKMPTTLKMRVLENWVAGDEPIKVEGNFQKNMKKGDLAYCRYGYLILFFEDQAEKSTDDFVKVGRITSNLDSLQELNNGADVKFSKAQKITYTER
jgi:hypothetical protein